MNFWETGGPHGSCPLSTHISDVLFLHTEENEENEVSLNQNMVLTIQGVSEDNTGNTMKVLKMAPGLDFQESFSEENGLP